MAGNIKHAKDIGLRSGSFIMRAFVILLVVYLVGFLLYAQSVSGYARHRPLAGDVALKSDGIVVLTGGAERLEEALVLLQNGQGKRLLISGVNPATTREDLRVLLKAGNSRLFDCCVDLDQTAVDTIGNATQAAHWAEKHDYQSLIVVTSAYHMPRSLVELAKADNRLALKPYAVAPSHLRLQDWWEHPNTARLLISEYTKYLLSRARAQLAQV